MYQWGLLTTLICSFGAPCGEFASGS